MMTDAQTRLIFWLLLDILRLPICSWHLKRHSDSVNHLYYEKKNQVATSPDKCSHVALTGKLLSTMVILKSNSSLPPREVPHPHVIAVIIVILFFVFSISADMPITVFAPNDLSFTKINPKIIAYLMSNPQDLSSKHVLVYRIVLMFLQNTIIIFLYFFIIK